MTFMPRGFMATGAADLARRETRPAVKAVRFTAMEEAVMEDIFVKGVGVLRCCVKRVERMRITAIAEGGKRKSAEREIRGWG